MIPSLPKVMLKARTIFEVDMGKSTIMQCLGPDTHMHFSDDLVGAERLVWKNVISRVV